ncbi:asparagine synthase (glutamine-hydrolyzing) [Pedobacter sp.]
MCGITGFIDYQKSISENDLLQASAALKHRGGDGNGHLYETHERYNVGLANERLATIDVSKGGAQPFTSLCGNYVITFNGTIYNYPELRATLIKYGTTFQTLSDTEVLLECYKKWGSALFDKIDGAFAFAILDRKQHQLFLARDTMGVKPLYFYKDKNFFAFASELKAMLKYPIEKKTNPNALEKYLRHGYFIGDETIFQNIWNFKKQHYFIIDLNSGNHLENRFENSATATSHLVNEAEITLKLNELITESILRRNVADVNVGVMLSGGYDSATVAAILQKNQAKKIRTFTLGFKDRKLNEAPAAFAIAQYLNTNHQEFYIDEQDAVQALESLPQIFDEPMGDSGAIPLAVIVKHIAKEDIKVLLGAEGGDELFAGYPNYTRTLLLHQKIKKIPAFLKRAILIFSKARRAKFEEIFKAEDLLSTYGIVSSLFTYSELSTLLNKDISFSTAHSNNFNSLNDILKYDQNNYLPNDLLLKSDRITMHYGIDNRDALLSTELVNFTNAIDENLILKNGNLKYLLKNITHQYIPKELMQRPKKGFNMPIVEWMKTIYKPYIEEYLSPAQLDKHKFFNIVEIFKIKNRFYNANLASDARKLWLLLQFQMWYNRYIE